MDIFICKDGKQQGPYTVEQVREWRGAGLLSENDYGWHQGLAQWTPVDRLPALAADSDTPEPSAVPPPLVRRQVVYAGFWRRFLAMIVDSFILGIVGFVTGLVTGAVVGGGMAILGASPDANAVASFIVGNVLGIVLGWLYFTIMESSSKQATLGKMVLGIVVTDMNGNRISLGRANGRYWGKLISSLTLLIGYIMAAFTEKKQALHDLMANTLVVLK